MPKSFIPATMRLLVTLLLLWSSLSVNAADQQIFSGQTKQISLGPYLEIFEDKQADLDIFDVASPAFEQRFRPVGEEQLSLGYSRSAFWLRFSIHWTDTSPLLLQLAYPLLDSIVFYLPNGPEDFKASKAGDTLPASIRELPSPDILFSMPAIAESEQTYYLRVQSGGSLQLPLYLWSTAEFTSENGKVRYIQGVYYGVMLVMILYNLFLFLFVKDRNYLHYVVYITSYLLFQLSLNGYAQLYLWPENPWWANRSVPFFVGLVTFFAISFSRQFLTTRKYMPRADWLLKGLMVFSLGIMLGGLFLTYDIMAPVSNIAGVLLPIVLLPTGYLSLRSGYRPARFYVIAWSMFLLGIFVTGLMFTGFVPRNLFTSYAMQVGSAMEVVLLSIALADRINILRREKEIAQRESTKNLQQLNEGLEAQVEQRTQELARHASMLEQTVLERTADLRHSNDELSRAVHAKDQFLATMSHELRTPLTAILGLSEILSGKRPGPLTDLQQRYIGIISDSGNHLLALINDILDIAQIESQGMELEPDWIQVEDICQASLALVMPAAEKKGQHIAFKRDPKTETVWADKVRLKQILVNLMGNAVKFTQDGGTIGLDVQGKQEDNSIEFTVWDTGCGIATEDLEGLFKPFVQLDNTFSRQHEGTGLGLNLVYRLTELHGGSIRVESEVGHGSRFIVRLTWNRDAQIQVEPPAQASNLPASDAASPRTGSTTVLMAEDNELNLIILSEFLTDRGFKILSARNGVEAVQMASNTHPDIILMDIQMPKMDGLEATRRIRALPQLASVPIIALTALVMPGDKERCMEAGTDSYLSKPVNLSQLSEEMTSLLKKHSST
ncbi:MAG: response regulator [Gammaproteobacteria bacterium (ex Lamellibrachia satsuma)]|nr:MAG: response regulator [Gammaproteobacteria bacterium (ex Lamellibrachia satsuma)]